MRRVRAIPKEKMAKIAEAKKAWKARKVQVLVEDPEVPTRVIISGRTYKVKLRKRVEYSKYKDTLKQLPKHQGVRV